MYNILICDDERDIVSALKIYLGSLGYRTFTAYNGIEAVNIVKNHEIHLILMDIMMTELDGISALRIIRRDYNMPVLLLTAKSEESDKIAGLNAGADDYITKPFNPAEVIARINSHLRRYVELGGCHKADSVIKTGGIELNDSAKSVKLDGRPVNLTPTEYDILKLLMTHCNEVLSPKEIYRSVWNDDPIGAESTVAVHIRHIREKIEISPAEPRYLKVVWGRGYKFSCEAKP